MPRITLYGPVLTPYTVKVARALRLKKLEFEWREPTSPEDYQRWSPETGLLPVLECDGERIADSTRILDFLDRLFPEPPLLSPDPRIAREQRGLESWISETFDFYILRWIRPRLAPLGPMSRMRLIGSDGKLRPEVFDTREGGPGPEFERRLDDLVKLLGPRPFFFGDRVSRADLAVFSSIYGMYRDAYPGSRALLDVRPALIVYVERVLDATGGPDASHSPGS
jgi:glutathione S-transferase